MEIISYKIYSRWRYSPHLALLQSIPCFSLFLSQPFLHTPTSHLLSEGNNLKPLILLFPFSLSFHANGIRFSLRTSIFDSITFFHFAFASSFAVVISMLWSESFCISLSRSFCFLCYYCFCAICFDLHAAVFSRLVWDLVESGVGHVTVYWSAEGTILFDVVLFLGLEICFCFINWKFVSTVKLGIYKLKEKWGWHSRSFSVGFLPRRKCEFWWLVLMLLVRPLSSTSSSSERSLQQFLPLVSFWTLFLFFGRMVLFLLL